MNKREDKLGAATYPRNKIKNCFKEGRYGIKGL
jgi:hypothetical protein